MHADLGPFECILGFKHKSQEFNRGSKNKNICQWGKHKEKNQFNSEVLS